MGAMGPQQRLQEGKRRPGIAVTSPSLWSKDQGFLPNPARPTGSAASFHADRRRQQKTSTEEGAMDSQLTNRIWSEPPEPPAPSPHPPLPCRPHDPDVGHQHPRTSLAARTTSPHHPGTPPRRARTPPRPPPTAPWHRTSQQRRGRAWEDGGSETAEHRPAEPSPKWVAYLHAAAQGAPRADPRRPRHRRGRASPAAASGDGEGKGAREGGGRRGRGGIRVSPPRSP
jgi:hypothetical protein